MNALQVMDRYQKEVLQVSTSQNDKKVYDTYVKSIWNKLIFVEI